MSTVCNYAVASNLSGRPPRQLFDDLRPRIGVQLRHASLNVLCKKQLLLAYASVCRLDILSNALMIGPHVQNRVYPRSELTGSGSPNVCDSGHLYPNAAHVWPSKSCKGRAEISKFCKQDLRAFLSYHMLWRKPYDGTLTTVVRYRNNSFRIH
jgi:hypothetical protein